MEALQYRQILNTYDPSLSPSICQTLLIVVGLLNQMISISLPLHLTGYHISGIVAHPTLVSKPYHLSSSSS